MAGGPASRASTGFGSLPTLPYYATFPKVLEHFQGSFMGSVVARNDTFIGGIDFIWARIGGSGVLQNPDSALYGGQDEPHAHEGFITAFGGVRVPLGIPNLSLYGTVGVRNFYSGTKLTVVPVHSDCSRAQKPSTRTGSCRSPASPRSIATTTAGSSIAGRPRRVVRQRHRTGRSPRSATIGRNHCYDRRLSRDVYLHLPDTDINGITLEPRASAISSGCTGRLPGQNTASDQTPPSGAHQASNVRVTRFMKAARRWAAVKFMS